MMLVCPSCGSQNERGRNQCRCGADLSLLNQVSQLVDAWFNQGLLAFENGELAEAMMWFSACCAANPTDAAAWLAQAKVWGQLGHFQEGQASLARARQIDPNLEGISETEVGFDQLREGKRSKEENQ